jgi:mersacidin/lichenicidin family type 2 lantibiotic
LPTATRPEVDIVRAWTDEAYYESLSEEEKALLPPNPAGELNLDVELRPLTKMPVMCLYETTTYYCTCRILHNTGLCTN